MLFSSNPDLQAAFKVELSRLRQGSVLAPDNEQDEPSDEIATHTTKFSPTECAEANLKLRALMKASGTLLAVTTGAEAMTLLLASERIYTDLVHTLPDEQTEVSAPVSVSSSSPVSSSSSSTSPSGPSWHVVVREFAPWVDLEWEFRGFVCDGRLTAVSQYWDVLYCPGLASAKDCEVLVRRMELFFRLHVQPVVLLKHYVIDFAVTKDKVVVVELNPFGPTTGPSLFTWRQDRRMLQGGLDVWGDLAAHEQKHSRHKEASANNEMHPRGEGREGVLDQESGVESATVTDGVRHQRVCVDPQGGGTGVVHFRCRAHPLPTAPMVWQSHWEGIEEPQHVTSLLGNVANNVPLYQTNLGLSQEPTTSSQAAPDPEQGWSCVML